jgi:hypothetical protein
MRLTTFSQLMTVGSALLMLCAAEQILLDCLAFLAQ